MNLKKSEQKNTQNFYRAMPVACLREKLSFNELDAYYRQLYGSDIKDHAYVSWQQLRDWDQWNELLSLIDQNCEIRRFDAGFCQGVALIKDGKDVARVTTTHIRRMKVDK